ncbi:MAG: RHS repeat protein [Nitrospira sp.]|nr:RHS repeat protein [Nitrospira sp.]
MRNRRTRADYTDGSFTTLTYDGAGNVATSTEALSRTTTFAYDVKNRLSQVTDPSEKTWGQA